MITNMNNLWLENKRKLIILKNQLSYNKFAFTYNKFLILELLVYILNNKNFNLLKNI